MDPNSRNRYKSIDNLKILLDRDQTFPQEADKVEMHV